VLRWLVFPKRHRRIAMNKTWVSSLQVDLGSAEQRRQLGELARARNWGLSLLLVGWLHLAAFSFCDYLTIVQHYNDSAGYLLVWLGELVAMGLIFRICGGPRLPEYTVQPLELMVRRVWIAYFFLAFNLGTLNTLRGHPLFELFPAIAPLASFAFLIMTLVVSWRFFAAVLVMFGSGLLMAAFLLREYLFFALAWWLVLNGVGWTLWRERRRFRLQQEAGHLTHDGSVLARSLPPARLPAVPACSGDGELPPA
jgi:hypothetical protein